MDYSFMKDYLAKPKESLAEHTEKLIAHAKALYKMGYLKDEKMLKNLIFACRYHDIGKMNPLFQQRVKERSKFDERKEVGHHLLSAYLVDLGEELEDLDYNQVTFAVMNHHHYNDDNYRVLGEKKEIIKELLSHIIRDLNNYAIPVTLEERWKTLSKRKINRIIKQENCLEARLLKGFLHKCDYAASSGAEVEYINDFLVENLQAYYDRNQYVKNEMQKFCQQHTDDNILITAPTGMGKTEAALWWLGNHKGIYVLPLRTAINEIYKRIRTQILLEHNIEHRLGVLHGETFSKYMEEIREESEYQKYRQYYEETRNLAMPLTVTTPDQIFNFVYHYDGYELKLANLSYSKVIIDEIQAYSPDLLAYLIYGLQSIVEAGGKFAIVTATFPPFIKTLLMQNLSKSDKEQSLEHMKGFVDQAFTHQKKRHYIEVQESSLRVEDIRSIYQRREDKKILVVCNTVRQAQDVYEQLQDCNCKLLHAKFLGIHREEKEKEIMEDGATYRSEGKEFNDKKVIWIATQIVEASLDIDFDYLFTELTDLNSLFQRLGRCNRKGVKPFSQPNCFIYTEMDSGLYLDGEKGFIDKTLHLLSKEAIINQGTGIISEQEKQTLIEKYFTYEAVNEKGSEFMNQYTYFYKSVADGYSGHLKLEEVKKIFRNIISYRAIPRVVYEEMYQDEIHRIEEEILDAEAKIRQCYERKQPIPVHLKRKQVKLDQELNGYCLSVGRFDIRNTKPLTIGKQEIYIVEGEYTKEVGYQRKHDPETRKKEEVVEDGFF